jgi:hypothetical protein
MKIAPRAKFVYATIVFIIVGLVIGGLLVETQASALAVCFFAWIIIGSWALSQIRCPSCDTSVAYQGKLGGLSIYAGLVRNKCQNCGHDLTTTDDEK